MKDWFEWNGVRCTELGIHVSEQPPITIPSERAVFTNVLGRSGSLTTLEGDEVYDDMILTVRCFVEDLSRLDEIIAYLKGDGKVEFANREGGFYYARIVNQIPFEKIIRGSPYRSFAVNFRCKPFWYLEDVSDLTITRTLTMVSNPSMVSSEPVITVYGSGDITLMVGATIIELTDVNGSITIDSTILECYQGVIGCNNQMSGDFPVLKPGSNAISWQGSVSRVVITPNWRYL